MWDQSITVAYQLFIVMLIYIAFKFDKEGMTKYLGWVFFFAALFLQQWGIVLWIDIATDAGKTAIADSLGIMYGNYPILLEITLVFFVFLVFLDIYERWTGKDPFAKLRKKPYEQGDSEAG